MVMIANVEATNVAKATTKSEKPLYNVPTSTRLWRSKLKKPLTGKI
jgi:hypothetical protein